MTPNVPKFAEAPANLLADLNSGEAEKIMAATVALMNFRIQANFKLIQDRKDRAPVMYEGLGQAFVGGLDSIGFFKDGQQWYRYVDYSGAVQPVDPPGFLKYGTVENGAIL